MSELLKQSSTEKPLEFLMIDSTDHTSPKTGLTPTVTLSKNGAAFAAPAGAVSEIGSGWYKVAANATDSNTLGLLVLHATATGADPTDKEYDVVIFDEQDGAALGLTRIDAAITSRLATVGYTAPDNADIVTTLADAASLLTRTDPTTALTSVKAVTDHLNTALELNGSNYRFTTAAMVNAPTGSGGSQNDAAIQADVQAVLNAVPTGSPLSGSVEALLTTIAGNQATMATTLATILSGVNGVPAALLATTIDGSLTFKQILDIQESIATGKYANTPSVSNGPQVTTYYRADGTTVLATDTVTFNGSGQPTGRTVAFTSP